MKYRTSQEIIDALKLYQDLQLKKSLFKNSLDLWNILAKRVAKYDSFSGR